MKIVADSFLQRMVRNIMGMLLRIGGGTLPPDEMHRMLAMRDRRFEAWLNSYTYTIHHIAVIVLTYSAIIL